MTGRANNTNGNGNGRPILAERFRTKLCEKFQATGECPYEWRCMFAHGEHELRTKEMNMADDLVTETAIKAFQKAREVAAKAKQKELAKAAAKKAAKKKAAAAAATPVAPPPSPESATSVVVAAAAVVLPTVVVGRRPNTDSGSTSAPATPPAVSPVFVPADTAERSPASVASGPRVPCTDSPRVPCTDSPRAPSYDASKYVSPLAAAMLGHRELVANAAKPQAARLPCTVTSLCVPSAYEDAAAGAVHSVLLP